MPLETGTPAAPAAPPAPTVAPTMEQVKAERHAGTAPPAPAAVDPAKPAMAIIDMDPADLKAAVALSKSERDARAKLKDAEPLAAKLAEVQALIKAGKHRDALKALEIDLNAAVAEELGAAPAGEPDPQAEVKAKLAELEAAEAERKKRDEEGTAKEQAAARAADVQAVVDHVKAEAAKYPYLNRKVEWVHAAYEDAAKAYPALVEKAGRDLNAEERHRLVTAALGEAEEEHKKTAALYGAPVTIHQPGRAQPSKAGARPVFDSSLRGGTGAPAVRYPKTVTFEEAKRLRRQG